MAFGLNRDFRSYCVESQCCADLGFASEHGTHRSTRHEHFDAPTSHNFCIVASLDRKRLGQDTSPWKKSRSEAFSMRRLGGSRWRLRRTRCAMGFECMSEIGLRDGRLAENSESGVGMVEVAGSERIGKPQRRLFRQGEDTNASACRSTSSWPG